MVFQPGQVGNPRGINGNKPMMRALQNVIALAGKLDFKKLPEDFKTIDLIAAKLLEIALEGDMQAIKEIFDRLDGKPIQQLEVKKSLPFEDWTTEEIIAYRDELRRTFRAGEAVGAISDQRGNRRPEAGTVPPILEAEIIP